MDTRFIQEAAILVLAQVFRQHGSSGETLLDSRHGGVYGENPN
jgi:hypothetical protein